jgi:excisionase family DNA binding protein
VTVAARLRRKAREPEPTGAGLEGFASLAKEIERRIAEMPRKVGIDRLAAPRDEPPLATSPAPAAEEVERHSAEIPIEAPSPRPPAEPLLTVDDVARELKVPRSTAYEYMAQMTRVLAGRHVRVTRAALDAWIASHTREPPAPRHAGPRPPVSGASRPPKVHVTYPRRRRTGGDVQTSTTSSSPTVDTSARRR